MFYRVATNAKDLEPKDKDKCLKSRNKLADPNRARLIAGLRKGECLLCERSELGICF